MTGIEQILLQFETLRRNELERWIANAWVRPQGPPYQFQEIDVARIRLIIDLRETMEVSDAALPTVLSLLDQLYEMRRHMHRLNHALAQTLPAETVARLLQAMSI